MNIVDHLALGIAPAVLPQDGPLGIRPVSFRAWDPLCHGLTCGDLDAAFINLPLAMDLLGAGLDMYLVMFAHRGGSLIAGRPSLSRLSEFKEKSLLIPHKLSIQHMLMHKLMTDRGMQLEMNSRPSGNAVGAEAVPIHLMSRMLQNDADKDIAGFICPDPFVSEAAIREEVAPFLTSQALWKNHPCCGLVVGASLLKDQDTIQYLVNALFRAAALLDREMSAGQILAPELIHRSAQFLETSRQCVIRALSHSGVTFSPALLIPEKAPLTTVQDYMIHTMGLLSSPVDLDTFVRPQFAKNAIAELSL